MIVVIAVLALVVVYMANKPAPGAPGSPLPTPDSIPATGSDGIPSPAKWIEPLAGTDAGQLVMDANPGLTGQQALRPSPAMPSSNVMRGTALSQTQASTKELIPQPGMATITRSSTGNNLRPRLTKL